MPDTAIYAENQAAGSSRLFFANPPVHHKNVDGSIVDDAVMICLDNDRSKPNPGLLVPISNDFVDHFCVQPDDIGSFDAEFHGHWPILKDKISTCIFDSRGTHFMCKSCNIPLCPSCFRAYHLR